MQDEDLDIIFGRFGACSSNIIRDRKTGDSLNYAFIEFDTQVSIQEPVKKKNLSPVSRVAPCPGFWKCGRPQWTCK